LPPHADPGRLPVSVLIGLALLPFAIPLLWIAAPVVFGQPPVLSIATPLSLALAASALCLAVVYTIDWSPATRVKGVLILVSLAYFAGLSLYFLKKEMVDGVRKVVGQDRDWKEFKVPGGNCKVNMPGKPTEAPGALPGWELTCYRASQRGGLAGPSVFTVGFAKDQNPAEEEKWFDAVKKSLVQAAGGQLVNEITVKHDDRLPGRQWEFHNIRTRTTRIVQVYRDKDRLYYLSAEGQNLSPDDRLVQDFFDSFLVTGGKD
jgi:hypothetical protein